MDWTLPDFKMKRGRQRVSESVVDLNNTKRFGFVVRDVEGSYGSNKDRSDWVNCSVVQVPDVLLQQDAEVSVWMQ